MAPARYEIRISGGISERARGAFGAFEVRSVPPETVLSGELAAQSDLRDVLTLCSRMGLHVVSLQRLPE